MTEPEAKSLAGELKGLMPMLTIEQGRAVKEALMQRDDIELCRNAIKAYAMDFEQFSLATFIDRLPPRPCDSVPAWDRRNFDEVKAQGERIQAQQEEDDAICAAMSDATFETLARKEIAKFDPDVQSLRCYSPLRKAEELRRSKHLTSLVAAHARAHGLVPGGLFQEVAR